MDVDRCIPARSQIYSPKLCVTFRYAMTPKTTVFCQQDFSVIHSGNLRLQNSIRYVLDRDVTLRLRGDKSSFYIHSILNLMAPQQR